MAGYTKRGKTWQYNVSRYIDGVYKPIRKGGYRTKKEAMIAATEVEMKLQKGIVPDLKSYNFDDYFEQWYKRYKTGIAETTIHHYEYTLSIIKEHLPGKRIDNMTRNEYQDFINEFGDGKSKETVVKVNSHIRSCVSDAIEDQITQVDFTRKVNIYYTVQAKKPSQKHLNYNGSKILMKELFRRLDDGLGYYMLLLALSSGLRYSEMVGLTRDDFDFKNNILNVNKTWGYKKRMKKGFNPTKNESSIRKVRVSKKVMTEFNNLFETMPSNIYKLVFYSPASKYRVLGNTNANKLLKKILKELKLEQISLHGLRHTFASILLYKRLSLGYVAECLGHKNTIKTQEEYSHVLAELKLEDSDQAASIFDKMAG